MDIVERAKGILLNPKSEWRAIEQEPGDPSYLFANYVAFLAAIPAVCGFIGASIVGTRMPVAGIYRVGIVGGLAAAVVHYVLAFVMVYVVAIVTDALAPTFGAQKSQPNALKLVAYSMTPVWLVGVFWLLPALGILGILGLYSLYLFWLGAPALMKVPADKSIVYTVAVVVCGIVISFIAGAIVHAIAWA